MVKQYLFIDESGDLGIKPSSSKVFVVAGVLFDDNLAGLIASQAITDLKVKLNLPNSYEFKFHRPKDNIKIAFYSTAKGFECQYYGLVVKKSALQYPDYIKCVTALIGNISQHTSPNKLNLQIIIDGQRSRGYQSKIRKSIRNNTPVKVANIKFGDSKNDELIQLADMCSGLIYQNETASENPVFSGFYNNIRRFYLS